MHSRGALLTLILLSILATGACDDDPQPSSPPPVTPKIAPSQHPRAKFKGHKRWGADLSESLRLPREQLCQELGAYDCLDEVHRIALGGVEPYTLGIDEPLEVAPVTAAMAVDRVALTACERRARMDLDDPAQAHLFGALYEATTPPDAASLAQVSAKLYRSLLRREATSEELELLVAFWDELQAADPSTSKLQWATMTCYALATSLESLFY